MGTSDRDLWQTYGNTERDLLAFFARNPGFDLSMRAVDVIDVNGDSPVLGAALPISSANSLSQYLARKPALGTKCQIVCIEKLSGDALKAIGLAFDIHLNFWSWVLSEEAADGYWLHNHNNGTILCFDLSTMEEWSGPKEIPRGYVFGGKMKQVSSMHRFNYNDGDDQPIFVNRRYTGYLTRRNKIPVFLYFSESSADNGQVALEPCPTGVEAPMPSWLLGHLAKNPHLLKCLAEDPFGFVAIIEGKLLANWSAFFARLAQDIEAADTTDIAEIDTRDVKIFTATTSLQRDISLILTRFSSNLEAHEGFLLYVVNGTKPDWRPGRSSQELEDLVKNARFLQTRLDVLRKRAQNILNFVRKFATYRQAVQLANGAQKMLSKISIRQAQLSFEQSERSIEMARLSRLDTQSTLDQGRTMKQLTILATIFLPSSTVAAILGMNVRELNSGSSNLPMGWFFLVAFTTTSFCFGVLALPNWRCFSRRPFLWHRDSLAVGDTVHRYEKDISYQV